MSVANVAGEGDREGDPALSFQLGFGGREENQNSRGRNWLILLLFFDAAFQKT